MAEGGGREWLEPRLEKKPCFALSRPPRGKISSDKSRQNWILAPSWSWWWWSAHVRKPASNCTLIKRKSYAHDKTSSPRVQASGSLGTERTCLMLAQGLPMNPGHWRLICPHTEPCVGGCLWQQARLVLKPLSIPISAFAICCQSLTAVA